MCAIASVGILQAPQLSVPVAATVDLGLSSTTNDRGDHVALKVKEDVVVPLPEREAYAL